jgi:hypothetical protein
MFPIIGFGEMLARFIFLSIGQILDLSLHPIALVELFTHLIASNDCNGHAAA